MNTSIKKVWHGFLTGVGFATAITIALFIYAHFEEEEPFGPDSGLVITSIKEKKTEHGIELVGTVKNTGSDSWNYVYVGVNFFDTNGEFVDSYKDSLDGVIAPGAEKYFKIKCGWKDRPLGEFDRYDASVIDALFKS